MYRIIFSIIFTMFYVMKVFAVGCQKVEWPFERSQSVSDVHSIMKLHEFDTNVGYLIFEISKENASVLEGHLFKYLIYNAKAKNVANFLKAIQWARTDNSKKAKIINELDFCNLYEKTLSLKN